MFPLTSYERKAVIFILGVFLVGAALHFLLRIQSLNRFFYQDMLASVERPAILPTRVNINTASADELMKIKGIGPALADRIIAYRIEHGNFNSIEDLTKVKGIGPKKLQSIKDSLLIQ